jgi:hypothetical protein
MGSPELTEMADFVGAGRVPEIDGAIADMAAAAIRDRAGPAWAPASTTPHWGRCGGAPVGEIRPPRSPGRDRSHRRERPHRPPRWRSSSTPVGPRPADRAADRRLGALTTQEEA